ncbi:MAG: hypothetical protein R3E50_06925 [Halioglobus sp.]
MLDPVSIEAGVSDVRVSVLHAAPEVGTVKYLRPRLATHWAAPHPIAAGFGDAAGPVALAADTQPPVAHPPRW